MGGGDATGYYNGAKITGIGNIVSAALSVICHLVWDIQPAMFDGIALVTGVFGVLAGNGQVRSAFLAAGWGALRAAVRRREGIANRSALGMTLGLPTKIDGMTSTLACRPPQQKPAFFFLSGV